MIDPIGTFLTRMDAALTAGMDQIIAAQTDFMYIPVTTAAVVYFIFVGVKVANGKISGLDDLVPNLLRVGTIIYLSSDLSGFNTWVRDIFFFTLPNTLAGVINGVGGSVGAPGVAPVTGTAAVFGGVWDGISMVVSTIYATANFTVMGAVTTLAAFFAGFTGGLGLAFMAILYISARVMLAVLVCLAPLIIGLGLFESTKGIVERGIGKAISLILLQTTGLIILKIILLADQAFIVQIQGVALNSLATANLVEALQVCVALNVWFFAGALAMLGASALAYSLGSGIMIPGPSAYSMAMIGRGIAGLAGAISGGGGGSGGPSPSPNFSLALAYPPLPGGSGGGGGAQAALPPPPPPAITHSTRRN